MSVGIYIFFRDHRTFDNVSLYNFSRQVDTVIPIFILNPDQVTSNKKNRNYFGSYLPTRINKNQPKNAPKNKFNHSLQFMCESLGDLFTQTNKKLCILYGKTDVVVDKVLKKMSERGDPVSCVGFHRDFSQYALKREESLKKVCSKNNVDIFVEQDDLTLAPLDELCKTNGEGFKKYYSFYNFVKGKARDPLPKKRFKFSCLSTYFSKSKKKQQETKNHVTGGAIANSIDFVKVFKTTELKNLYAENKNIAQRGGRKNGLRKLARLSSQKSVFKKYNVLRNDLSFETLNISGYLNFGCLSVREVYRDILKKLGKNSELLKQLWWRDFFLQAAVYLPGGNEFDYMDKRYKKIKWKNGKSEWLKVISGKTGYLIVDAGMNQMRTTGFMHNRARMIVGNFWTKYCLIDTFHPVYGSQVGYSKFLLDAVGISQNKMNQHWITEFDYSGKKFSPKGNPLVGRPMDVSNSILKKFDPKCEYVKRWIPELKDVPNQDLIHWSLETFNSYKVHVAPMFPDAKIKFQQWVKACQNAK
jgi:deoxyribodipyrimidine photo-lyase